MPCVLFLFPKSIYPIFLHLAGLSYTNMTLQFHLLYSYLCKQRNRDTVATTAMEECEKGVCLCELGQSLFCYKTLPGSKTLSKDDVPELTVFRCVRRLIKTHSEYTGMKFNKLLTIGGIAAALCLSCLRSMGFCSEEDMTPS